MMEEDTGDRVVRTPEELAHDPCLNDSTPQVQGDLLSSITMAHPHPSNMISTKTNTDTSMTNMAMGMIKDKADSMMT